MRKSILGQIHETIMSSSCYHHSDDDYKYDYNIIYNHAESTCTATADNILSLNVAEQVLNGVEVELITTIKMHYQEMTFSKHISVLWRCQEEQL